MKLGILCMTAAVFLLSCAGTQTTTEKKDTTAAENAAFLETAPENAEELFRVVIMSDSYQLVQKNGAETISRSDDKSGDKFIADELNKFNKINESREAILSVSLFPDTGRIMKIRPKRLAALREIDELVVEDLQRWSFVSPKKKPISPLKFDVRYKVVLRKKQSDDEIIKEVREKMKEKSSQ